MTGYSVLGLCLNVNVWANFYLVPKFLAQLSFKLVRDVNSRLVDSEQELIDVLVPSPRPYTGLNLLYLDLTLACVYRYVSFG